MAESINQAVVKPGPAPSSGILEARVLVTGASGQIGIFAIPRLVKAGFQVFAVSRKGKPEAYPDFDQVKWLSESDALQYSQSCQCLLSAGPMELARKFQATGGQFQKAVVFSSSSVETKQQSGNQGEKTQIQGLLELESKLQLSAESAGQGLLILRPTLIYGCGLDSNISRLANWIRRFGFMPVNGRAAGLRQPVHADDLAAAAVTALLSKEDLSGILSLTGGDTMTYSDMAGRIFQAMNRPVRLMRLPEWFFVLLVRMANFLKLGGDVNCEMVKRQRVDMVFDDLQARELLNYNPRPFAPTPKDFSIPDF